MIKVVLISGKARAGKSTSALYIREKLRISKRTRIMSFASEVKNVAHHAFDWDYKKDKKGRVLLTDIGKIARKYNPAYWVNIVIHEIKESGGSWELYIIDDWRFVNEYDQMCKVFGKENVLTLRIERDDIPKATTDDYFDANDETETELDDFPFELTMPNNHCLDELKSQLGYLVKQHNFFNIGE